MVQSTYEAAEVAACTNLIQPGDRILELGGAIGFIGLYCLINRGAASVISVEANPHTVESLRDNYLRNGRTAQVINAAVAEESGSVEFCVGTDFWTDGLHANAEGQRRIVVEGKPFSTIWEEAKGTPNALITDIEGAEIYIDWRQLPKEIETIIIEIHPSVYGHPAAFRILQSILDKGFEVRFFEANVFGLKRVSNS
jgi:FkbM family methyltransferase